MRLLIEISLREMHATICMLLMRRCVFIDTCCCDRSQDEVTGHHETVPSSCVDVFMQQRPGTATARAIVSGVWKNYYYIATTIGGC
jgi:hypothetical protein